MDCLEKLVKCIERFNKGEIDADTSCQIEKQILTDEIDDPELLNFAVENISELFGYIATGRINIRICRDITGEIWFGVDTKRKHSYRNININRTTPMPRIITPTIFAIF